MNKLEEELKSFLVLFEPYAKNYFRKRSREVSTYPELIQDFYKELEDFMSRGKKLRAFLVYLGYVTLNGNRTREILQVALAVELVHNFLLIHDDIIDQSDVRRNKPTVHKKFEKGKDAHYGISQAIIAGDIAMLEAIKLVNSLNVDNKVKTACLDNLLQTILETGYGEGLDIEYSRKKATVEDILQIAELKTAKYSFVGPLTLGAILADASKLQLKHLRDFGMNLGIAFQLQDDILGIFGDEKITGKSTISDMREGKNTILIHKTRQSASPKDKKRLDSLWGRKDTNYNDLELIKKIITTSGARKWCEKEMEKMVKSAKVSIPKITKNKKLKRILTDCADFVIYRQK